MVLDGARRWDAFAGVSEIITGHSVLTFQSFLRDLSPRGDAQFESAKLNKLPKANYQSKAAIC